MFRSQTYGNIEIEKIPEKLKEFYENNLKYGEDYEIVVGTDSQTNDHTKIVSVIAIICHGHGGIYFYKIEHVRKLMSVREKLETETSRSLDITLKLIEALENNKEYKELYSKVPISLHIDAGNSENGKTKDLIAGLVGWVHACGYECKVKPDAYVASTIADRISK